MNKVSPGFGTGIWDRAELRGRRLMVEKRAADPKFMQCDDQ